MRKFVLFILFIIFANLSFSQQEDILMTVGDKKISADEFLHIYKKNNSENVNEQSLNEYLDLFKNFKLKVVEAETLKMDTSFSFINELQGYKDQLAKPYLTENLKYEELIKEAYIRNQTELKLDIIFIRLSKNASIDDTLLTYEKAISIRNRILSGESFEKVATETSDDRQVSENKGHLPFLPSLRIPYNIQNFAFNAKKGTLSMPLRASYGLYVVRLVDTRPSQGKIKVAHIMINSTDQLSDNEKTIKKQRIDSIYNRILKGDKFETLVKHSDDKGTTNKSGELPEFTTGVMVPEFELAAFNLKEIGEISKPIKSNFGWHIIKLLENGSIDKLEDQKDQLKKTVETDPDRKDLIKKYVLAKLKTEYDFKNINNPEIFYSLLDSSIYKGKWIFYSEKIPNETLFTINSKKYSSHSFGKFLESKQKKAGGSFNSIVENAFEDYIYESLTEIEKENLEKKNPSYKYLMQEYHDGMLIFELMKKEVWDKATEDSIGLKQFYSDNIQNYNTKIELDISVFKYSDVSYYNNAVRLLTKSRDKYSDDQIVEKISGSKKKLIKIENGTFSKGENIYADKIFKLMKEGKILENQKIVNFPTDKSFVYINKKQTATGNPFNEIKGLVISDYQIFLEEEWIKDLKAKYKIITNEKILKKIISSLN